MNVSKIGTKEAIYLVLIITIAHSILSMPKYLIDSVKSSIILNLVFVFIVLLCLCLLIVKLFKNFPGMDILDVSEYLGGKHFKRILGTVFITYFILSISVLLREFCDALEIVYYPMTDIAFLVILFTIVIAITGRLEFSASIKANLIVVPLVLFSMVFLFFANIKNYSSTSIFPILGNGFYNTFILGLGNIYAFSGIFILYFLPPLIKKPEDFKKITVISVIIFAIYILLTVLIILFTFSFFVSENEILPLYAAARYIELGTFFVRLESIFLLIWIFAFACYLSIVVRFAMITFKKITNIKETKPLAYPFAILTFAIAMIPDTYAQSKQFENILYPYVSVAFLYVFCILLLVFASLKRRKDRKE